MSTYVVGFRPPDEEYERMRSVYSSCLAANVTIPEEVQDFFNYGPPSEHGTEVSVPSAQWSEDMCEGLEVDVSALPPNVKILRFYNSY